MPARAVLAANYMGGSLCAIARRPDGSLDGARVQIVTLPPASHPITYPLPNAGRQEKAHAHMVVFSQNSVLVPDLGSDLVWALAYDAEANEPLSPPKPTASVPMLAGGGPRHVALHPTKPVAYVAYELTSVVAAYATDPSSGAIVGPPLPPGPLCVLDGKAGALTCGPEAEEKDAGQAYAHLLQREPNGQVGHGLKAWCAEAKTSIAAIRVSPSGSQLVVSSRLVGAPGALSALDLDASGRLTDGSTRIASTLGRTPRDFALLPTSRGDTLALAANQDSDSIVALCPGHTEPVELTTLVPTPVCLCFAPEAGAAL
jgi:6-phosphogluconolactonase (cycloisomerase 2 family)